jgi:hypothetical protein
MQRLFVVSCFASFGESSFCGRSAGSSTDRTPNSYRFLALEQGTSRVALTSIFILLPPPLHKIQ